MYSLLTYDKLQQWVCHEERKKERSKICIYLFSHLNITVIFLTTSKKEACIILALSRSEAWHGWRENLIETTTTLYPGPTLLLPGLCPQEEGSNYML